MDLDLTETQALVVKTARDYAERVIRPVAAELDRESASRAEILKGLAELGLMGVNVPAALGGAEAGVVAYALAMMEIARACASTAVTMAVTNMVGEVIARFGTDAQRERYVPRLTSGEYVAGAFALSEPEAGSDPGLDAHDRGARARRVGAARPEAVDHERLVRRRDRGLGAHGRARARGGSRPSSSRAGRPGLKLGKHEDKLGLRASNTVPLTLRRLPRARRTRSSAARTRASRSR